MLIRAGFVIHKKRNSQQRIDRLYGLFIRFRIPHRNANIPIAHSFTPAQAMDLQSGRQNFRMNILTFGDLDPIYGCGIRFAGIFCKILF